MPIVNISPVWNGTQFLTETGQPLVGGKIYTYEGGSTTAQKVTYSNNTGTAENPNPIVLDTTGRMPTDIWLVPGQLYNLVLKTPAGATIKSVDNVSVSQLIAGENISIDPASGIGAVTITGLWPKYITTSATRGRTYLYWLENVENSTVVFDGTEFTDWTATQKLPLNQSTPDVTWDANNQLFTFNNAGSYIVTVTGKLNPDVGGESGDWPAEATVYGIMLTGGNNTFKSYHNRYAGSWGDNLPTEEQQTTWTDEYTISVAADTDITFGVYALAGTYNNIEAFVSASVMICRIGDPYVQPTPPV